MQSGHRINVDILQHSHKLTRFVGGKGSFAVALALLV